MKGTYFIGFDISKLTVDVTIVYEGKCLGHHQVVNQGKKLRSQLVQILRQHKIAIEDCVFCMENTGIYTLPALKTLNELKAPIWLESSLNIKKSMGLVRGKNDKIDSKRIALFAFTHRHQMKLWQPARPVIQRISHLLACRQRLIKAKKQLTVPLEEQKQFLDKASYSELKQACRKSVHALEGEIKAIEQQLKKIIREDQSLHKQFTIITSIPGVGMMTALYTIVTSNEFITIPDAKKYACYAGVVPFEHTSGTRLSAKSRVSTYANKNLKTIFQMAALSASKYNPELKTYFERKVAEGKNKMLVLNNIRNKLVLRIFACIKQDRIYQPTFSLSKVA